MILSKVRDYVKTQISAIDSNLVEWGSPFDSSNIPETLADRAYFIKYDVASTSESQTTISDRIDVEVQFFFKGFRDELNEYDDAMDKVNTIRIKCISISSIEAFKSTDENPIYEVISTSQLGEMLSSNERQIIITLNLVIGLNQVYC